MYEKERRIIELFEGGVSIKDIRKELNTTTQFVRDVLKSVGYVDRDWAIPITMWNIYRQDLRVQSTGRGGYPKYHGDIDEIPEVDSIEDLPKDIYDYYKMYASRAVHAGYKNRYYTIFGFYPEEVNLWICSSRCGN